MSDLTVFQECGGEVECISDTLSDNLADMGYGLNYFFLIFGGALVYFMQLGFAMLLAGSVRSKNCSNILLWNLLDSCGGAMAYWLVGYSFAYGGDNADGPKTFIGWGNPLLTGNVDYSINYAFWFFQFAFACAVSSIVAGTVAERCKMSAYLCFSVFLVGFVYPVVSHAYWSMNGFLSTFSSDPLWGQGIIDLAGSGPVHMTGGVAALAGSIVIGPRRGRFYDEAGNPLAEPLEIPPHSVSLQFLGTFALWFGWYGFNPASVLVTSTRVAGNVASLVAVNTTLAAASAALSAMFTSSAIDSWKTGIVTYDLTMTMNGCLTGLAAITAPCASVEPWWAVVIGIIAGWVYIFGSWALIKLRIDDCVDAVPVHMLGGLWGDWSAGLFSSPTLLANAYPNSAHAGWFYNGSDFTLMGIQLIGTLFVFGWTFSVMFVFFWVLKYFNLLRIDALEEEVGMDLSFHKNAAYDINAVKKEFVDELVLRRSSHGTSAKLPAMPKVETVEVTTEVPQSTA